MLDVFNQNVVMEFGIQSFNFLSESLYKFYCICLIFDSYILVKNETPYLNFLHTKL